MNRGFAFYTYVYNGCVLVNVLESVYLAATGLGTLRQLSKSKVQYVPTLGMVIPYLELSSKQEYLVQRIKGDLI